jgi:hypothetical protein
MHVTRVLTTLKSKQGKHHSGTSDQGDHHADLVSTLDSWIAILHESQTTMSFASRASIRLHQPYGTQELFAYSYTKAKTVAGMIDGKSHAGDTGQHSPVDL